MIISGWPNSNYQTEEQHQSDQIELTSNDENHNEKSFLISLFDEQNSEQFSCNLESTRDFVKRSFQENSFAITLSTLIYFSWFLFVAGLAPIHLLVYFLLLSCYLLSDRTRRFMFAVLIYLAYLLVYDALRLLPNYTVSEVHIRDVYLFEKRLFGVYFEEQLLTWNEYFQRNHVPILDVFTGVCYLNWWAL